MGQFDNTFVVVESSKAKLKSGIESGIICLIHRVYQTTWSFSIALKIMS